MTVDLSFYDVPWYTVTEGNDMTVARGRHGQGASQPTPSRRNNLTLDIARLSLHEWLPRGQDACGARMTSPSISTIGNGRQSADGTDQYGRRRSGEVASLRRFGTMVRFCS